MVEDQVPQACCLEMEEEIALLQAEIGHLPFNPCFEEELPHHCLYGHLPVKVEDHNG